MKKILLLLTLCIGGLAGCQASIDGGMYRLPRLHAGLYYKGEDETENHAASRDTGTFGTGNSFGMVEHPTNNRKAISIGMLSGNTN